MRAVIVRETGPPEVLVECEAPEPVAGAGEVLIDVEYANITFVETRLAEVRREETVLVEAAAGGVGTLLVQLAGNAGARVIAVAGGPLPPLPACAPATPRRAIRMPSARSRACRRDRRHRPGRRKRHTDVQRR